MKRGVLISLIILLTSAVSNIWAQSSVVSTTCEYRENPIGIDVEKPRLSWKIESEKRGVEQQAYQICVATSERDLKSSRNVVWDSGKVTSDKSIHIEYNGRQLENGERVYWRVRVWDNSGRRSKWSDIASWEMGVVDPSYWESASWITSAAEGEITRSLPSHYYRKEFNLNKKLKRARAYISSLGTYQLYINGAKVSDDLFAPGWTSYHKRLQYQVYDVTEMLTSHNSIGAMVGDGWYRGKMAWKHDRAYYGDRLGLIMKLEVEYTDGTREIVQTDDSWKYNYGAIVMSDWYDGETYDARKELTGWNKPNYNDKGWKSVEKLDYPKEHLVATVVDLPQAIEELSPIKMFRTPKGEYVADLGQNIVGWVRFSHQGERGDSIKLTFAEVLDPDGNFYTENLRTAEATDRFILKGGEKETFEPHFTFHGFRYVKFEGVDKMPSKDDVVGVVIHTPMAKTGEFETSDKLINQLQSNIVWSHRDNFLDVPTDCPQRDERLGWTGDAQVFSQTASFNYNVANFFTKWLYDLSADQKEDGRVPHVIPNVLPPAGATAWADAALIVPYVVYKNYGDVRILESQYPSMVKWVEYMERSAAKDKDFLWKGDFHYGDWLSHPSAITDKDLVANAYFYYSTTLISKIAAIIGKDGDVKRWDALASKVKAAFNKEYVTPNGRLMSDTQTAYLMAISFGLLPESLNDAAKESLTTDVARNKHLTTGFVGTSLLCNTLSEIGRDDLAFMLMMRKQFPSWLYPVTMGATTIWERWDALLPDGQFNGGSMNSFNHYSYGAIGEWMYSRVAGIKGCESSPAYKHFKLSPHVGGGLTSASAKYDSMYGKIESSWKIEGGQFVYNITIPANSTADVILPNATATDVKIDCDVEMSQDGQEVKFALGSGSYAISYPYKK